MYTPILAAIMSIAAREKEQRTTGKLASCITNMLS